MKEGQIFDCKIMASLTTLFLSRIYLPFKSTFLTLIVFFFLASGTNILLQCFSSWFTKVSDIVHNILYSEKYFISNNSIVSGRRGLFYFLIGRRVTRKPSRRKRNTHKSGTQRQFSENYLFGRRLRSRIYGSFSDKFLACLSLLGFSNFKKIL